MISRFALGFLFLIVSIILFAVLSSGVQGLNGKKSSKLTEIDDDLYFISKYAFVVSGKTVVFVVFVGAHKSIADFLRISSCGKSVVFAGFAVFRLSDKGEQWLSHRKSLGEQIFLATGIEIS